MNTGERLREERERLGLSQERFAAIGGVQKRAQINYESGDRAPDAVYLGNVASIGADVAYVVTGKRAGEATVSLSAEESTMLEYFRAAPAAVKRAALGALLGATVSSGQVMKRVGDGAVQIGSIGGDFQTSAPRARSAGKPKEK